MKPELLAETEKLTRCWEQHDHPWLRDYLVSGVEDPRLNLQSILTRHFLVRQLVRSGFEELMSHEYRFAAVMDWLLRTPGSLDDPETSSALLYGLRKNADNVEGVEIPACVLQTFATLPMTTNGVLVPNYIERLLSGPESGDTLRAPQPNPVLNNFAELWTQALSSRFPAEKAELDSVGPANSSGQNDPAVPRPNPALPSLLEPACGSANDYRFLQQYGLARLFNYQGFDLCQKNVDNARALFPNVRFEKGNVFEIPLPDKSTDYCMVQDLFEHLSLAGLGQAVQEICRVTRLGICVGFFQMDELPDHLVRPRDEYYWNLLSMERMKRLFAGHGFTAQAIHIGTFLSQQIGCTHTHNPNAYTFVLRRA